MLGEAQDAPEDEIEDRVASVGAGPAFIRSQENADHFNGDANAQAHAKG